LTRAAISSSSEGRTPGSTTIVCSSAASSTEFMANALLWRTSRPSPRSVQAFAPAFMQERAASLLAGRHDVAGDDLVAQRVHRRAHRVGDLRLVAIVVDPRHTLLLEPE